MSRHPGQRRVTQDVAGIHDAQCTVLHVDMDAFFAAVELRRRPELRGRPMMVAGAKGRGVVLSATYEARAYGVRSAMPTVQALARCPGVAVVAPDHDAYRAASKALMELLGEITPIVEPVSVDEAFLDVAGVRRLAGRPGQIATTIRSRVRHTLGLTATVGAASTKFIAKLASSWAKPDGLLLIPPEEVLPSLRPLPVDALWGVGPRTADRLRSCGFTTIGDIADADLKRLETIVGRAHARTLHELSSGRDPRRVTPGTTEVSVGAEQTFTVDLRDADARVNALLELSGKAARRARRAGIRGHTVTVKVRFDDFTTITRSATVDHAVDSDRDVHAVAMRCWQRVSAGPRAIRLLGVRIENLVRASESARQLQLDIGTEASGWSIAQDTVDDLTDRFGAAAPRPAALLPHPGGRDITH